MRLLYYTFRWRVYFTEIYGYCNKIDFNVEFIHCKIRQ